MALQEEREPRIAWSIDDAARATGISKSTMRRASGLAGKRLSRSARKTSRPDVCTKRKPMRGNRRFSEFICSERKKFEIDDNNVFAYSFSHISRYRDFLSRILKRHRKTSRRFVAVYNEYLTALKPGRHTVDRHQMRQIVRRNNLIAELHMEIEVFYIFAKILLDKIAHSIEFYFGPVNKASLDSHDQLVKHLERYRAGRKLQTGEELQRFASIAGRLKRDISDFRDYQIAHEKSPRTSWFTLWDGRIFVWV